MRIVNAAFLAIAPILLASFHAAALAQTQSDEAQPLGILLAVGDIAECDKEDHAKEEHLKTAALVREQIAAAKKLAEEDQKGPIPVRVLLLGDLAYDKGKYKEEFIECFDKSWKDFKDIMLPASGNHEYKTPGAAGYFRYFADRPVNDEGKPLVQAGKGYYSVNFPDASDGPWHLTALDSELTSAGWKAQKEWLKKDLASAVENKEITCILAYWHVPVFSSGSHGHASTDKDANLCDPNDKDPPENCSASTWMVWAFQDLFDVHASVLLTGHDHNFEQLVAMNPLGKPDENGLRSFVVGTGGQSKGRIKYTVKWPNEAFGNSYGILKIQLYQDWYSWDFIPIKGDGNDQQGDQDIAQTETKDTCNLLR